MNPAIEKTAWRKRWLWAALLASALVPAASAQPVLPVPEKSATVHVEAVGEVPGFTQPQLERYLAQKMQQSGPWHFVAGKAGQTQNLVVWKFKVLRIVWKGGSHNGFPSPGHAVSYLSAEVKRYSMGEYQMTMDTHPSVLSGDEDHALAEMARHVMQAMFEDN